ncbi:MAG TPA: pyridoxal-phosphate dependent enzyme [Pseudonocardiaceae bacterium]
MDLPDLNDVLSARRLLAGLLPPTPMWSYPLLDETVGATVYIKHEQVQPTGAFKVRGGLNLLAGWSDEERGRGVVTFSTGNHAQSIAYAARHFAVACTVVMPVDASEAKVHAVRALGARVDLHGAVLEDCGTYATELADRDGARLVEPGADAALISGVATAYLEMIEAVPDLDMVFVPVGSGTGAAAACLVVSALAPRCRVIAVQSGRAQAAHDSWRAGEVLSRPNRTAVAGLATGTGFALPQAIMARHLADFLLVDDADIVAAQRILLRDAHTLVEGAGAAALAGLLAVRDTVAGARVAVMCSGGMVGPAEVAVLSE